MPTRIWVIDDEAAIGNLFCESLIGEGFAPERIGGAEALRRLDVGRKLPSCIITDIKMPGVDGNAILRRIKALGAIMPVVVVTAYRDSIAEDVRDVPSVMLDKPMPSLSILTDGVRTALNGSHVETVWWTSPKIGAAVLAILTLLAGALAAWLKSR